MGVPGVSVLGGAAGQL